MKRTNRHKSTKWDCRSPRGARGFKRLVMSNLLQALCRAPRGARGLKLVARTAITQIGSRAQRGARGLKLVQGVGLRPVRRSRPARGAWIETDKKSVSWFKRESRPARGAWIET